MPAIVAVATAGSATGQALASNDVADAGRRCDPVDVTNRLRLAHPLGAAARPNGGPCLGDAVVWVPTAPMAGGHRLAWRRAVGALAQSDEPECRLAANTLVWLEQVGVVSVWTPADTAAGLVYFGSAYARETSAPLAVQFWAPAFDRPVDWLAGALAHEAFHILQTGASEEAATAFGDRCRRGVGRLDQL
jgi:hypothetical protein